MDFDLSSVELIINDSEINMPPCDDNYRREFSSIEPSASHISPIIILPVEQIITLDSSDDENASRDQRITQTSLPSANVTPLKCVSNAVSVIRKATKVPSCSSETKRQKESDSSFVKPIQNDSEINMHPKCADSSRIYCTSTKHSVSSSSSSITMLSDEPIITLDSSDDENASRDQRTAQTSLPSNNLFSDEQVTLDSANDENASNDCYVDEPSTSANANRNYDSLSAEETTFNLDEEFPYECIHCNERFSEARNLFFHSKIHGKSFICKRCNRPFYSGSAFIHHIERHTQLRGIPFNCPICNYGFSHDYYLRRHMNEFHRSNQGP